MSKAKCLHCNTIIESKHRHDFVVCKCFSEAKNKGIFLDGGNEYLRSGGNMEHFKLLNGVASLT